MRNFTLDGRLSSAAKFVRQGARFADIGTDHAYLPIFLLRSGRIDYAFASDINDGPLASAIENAREAGVYSKMEFALADGLDAIRDKDITDIAICGMGGELIASIVERADFIKTPEIRLILQPMRNVADVRAYLLRNGFCIIDEALAREEDRIYEIICAEYSGEPCEADELALLLGTKNIEKRNDGKALFGAFCEKHASALRKKTDGMKKGGANAEKEEALLAEIEKFIAELA